MLPHNLDLGSPQIIDACQIEESRDYSNDNGLVKFLRRSPIIGLVATFLYAFGRVDLNTNRFCLKQYKTFRRFTASN